MAELQPRNMEPPKNEIESMKSQHTQEDLVNIKSISSILNQNSII